MRQVEAGVLQGGTPYLAVGDGPPVVSVLGLTPTHDVPTGFDRRMALSMAAPLAAHFRVYVVNRKQGLRPGESMADIAGHLASDVEYEVGGPVHLVGTSTGGSVALQLSVDRPDLVRALVVIASAYRLGPSGRDIQRELARLIRAGDPAGGFETLVSALLPAAARGPLTPVTRLLGRTMSPADPRDLLVTVDAEDAFDVEEQLPRITAPTLVIGGARDVFYPAELFRRTAAGVADGRAHIEPAWGHGRTCSSSTTATLTLGFLLAATGR